MAKARHGIHGREDASMERRFDLVVVGTGVTSAVATRCREAGWTVAVVDSRPFGSAADRKQVPFAYPTYGSDIRFML
jgi:glycine/D-amino acid oxidase-like deaminating enzyme